MKKLLMMLLLSVPGFAFAEDCSYELHKETVAETREIKTDVPSHLKDAEVCIFYPTGPNLGYHCVSADKFKVVPRKQQFIVTKTTQTGVQMCKASKNRLSVLAGEGTQEGLKRRSTPTKVTVESDTGSVGGLQYQRLLDSGINVGVQGQSNETVLFNIGIDF